MNLICCLSPWIFLDGSNGECSLVRCGVHVEEPSGLGPRAGMMTFSRNTVYCLWISSGYLAVESKLLNNGVIMPSQNESLVGDKDPSAGVVDVEFSLTSAE